MISLLHPSRGRPGKSWTNAQEWIEKAGCDVELILSLDTSDSEVYKYTLACVLFSKGSTCCVKFFLAP